jgi:hypothetical protein
MVRCMSEPIPAVLLAPECEAIRCRMSVAFMLGSALEVQTRLAADLDPELHRLLSSAHGQALHVMTRERAKLREARQNFHERERSGAAA